MAAVMWVCPVRGCPVRRDRPGNCNRDLVQLVREETEETAEAAETEVPTADPAPAALTLDCAWGQLIDIPADGLDVGRSSPAFRGGGIEDYDQVSRVHARLFWADGRLRADDIGSANGTYVDGVRIVPGEPVVLSAGQELRLAEDVPCKIVQLNEFGEPV